MLLLIAHTSAATLLVDPTDGAAYASIQAAIDAAIDGDTVSVAAGSYVECLDLGGRSLTLEGGATVASAAGCAAGSQVVATSGEVLVVRGLSFTNPVGRVFEVVGGALELDGVTVADVDNTATWMPGAAVSITNGSLTVTGSTFQNLRSAEGGAIFAEDADVVIDSSSFVDGFASYYGGAIEFYSHGDDSLDIGGSTFTGCEADAFGGSVLYAWTYDVGDLHTTTIDVSTSTFAGSASAVDAGALALLDVDAADIDDNRFEANAAVIGGAIHAEGTEALSITGNSFVANTTSTSVAGAVYVRDGVATLRRNLFVGNEATGSIAGALELYDTSATVLNNTFVGNAGRSSTAAGTLLVRNSWVDFRNNLVAYTTSGPAIWVYDSSSSGTWAYNNFWENTDGDTAAYAMFSTSADGNLVADPSLVAWSDDGDYTNDDLRLATGSPLIDAGDPSILDDDGTVSDIGALAGAVATDSDGDGYGREVDCDDHDPARNPGVGEVCDGVDQDCDGDVDEDASDLLDWYLDADADGWGGDSVLPACETPEGYVGTDGDCDDMDATISPGADEACNAVDDDCDATIDEEPVDGGTFYTDVDGDGFGMLPVVACVLTEGLVEVDGDCDDLDAAVSPDAPEVCNEVDDNCDGAVDELGATGGTVYHPDDDGDGFGDSEESEEWCSQPEGWTEDAGDCDDTEATTWPGAPDTWYDGVDSDCAGDDDDDQDRDGYGIDEDCEDTDPAVHPGADDEWYDGVDSDCAGNDDDDQDLDGIPVGEDCDDLSIAVYPGAPDTWYDGVDSDCQGDDDFDQDRDGTALDADCDDTNAAVHPGATDIAGDDIDQDCDGEDRSVEKDGGADGCGCATGSTPATGLGLLLVLVAVRRRSS